MTSLFRQSTSLSSKAIFQHYLRMEFAFHNSYIILELVSSMVIFWRAQLLTQKLLKQSYVAPKSSLQKLCGRHDNAVNRNAIYIPQLTMDLLLFTQTFSFLQHCQYFYMTLLYISVTRWVPLRSRNCLPCART